MQAHLHPVQFATETSTARGGGPFGRTWPSGLSWKSAPGIKVAVALPPFWALVLSGGAALAGCPKESPLTLMAGCAGGRT